MGFIYKHTNKINGKVYIGQTIVKPEYRWSNGKGYLGSAKSPSKTHFSNAIKKYGWLNFEHEIICECENSKLDELERYYIKKYNSNDSNFGYNSDSGGSLLKRHNAETIKKLSELNKGEKNGFYGRHHTEESKEKQRKNYKYHVNSGCFQKGHKQSPNVRPNMDKYKKNIVAINIKTGEKIYFKGIKFAARQLGLSAPSITRVLHKRRKATGGYNWFFVEEVM